MMLKRFRRKKALHLLVTDSANKHAVLDEFQCDSVEEANILLDKRFPNRAKSVIVWVKTRL